MKNLWIEDQPTEHESQFFPKHIVDGTIHELVKTKSFDDAYEKVESACESFDFIIIDINLEHFDLGDQGKKLRKEFGLGNKEFATEAGFHLYLRLIQQGFDNERIIFLTAYTIGNQFDMLRRKLDQAAKLDLSISRFLLIRVVHLWLRFRIRSRFAER